MCRAGIWAKIGYLKAKIHCTIFTLICSLESSTQVPECFGQDGDFGQSELTNLTENHILYNAHRLKFH